LEVIEEEIYWGLTVREDLEIVGFNDMGKFLEVVQLPRDEAKACINKTVAAARKFNIRKKKTQSKTKNTRRIRNVTIPSTAETHDASVDEDLIVRIRDKSWIVKGKIAHIKGEEDTDTFTIDFEEFCENTGRALYYIKGRQFYRDASGVYRLAQDNA